MDILLLFFQDAGTSGGYGLIGMLAPFAVIFAIFYFLVIVPQKKQKQQLQEMIGSLRINDEIVTSGGIIGKVKEIRDSSVILVSADKSFLEIGKSAVVGKRPEAGQ
jgi:preprotein translocase subunit YajC